MIKAELVNKLSVKTGVERKVVSAVIETFMETVKKSLENSFPTINFSPSTSNDSRATIYYEVLDLKQTHA